MAGEEDDPVRTTTKAITVQYERPPLRAVYQERYEDAGQTDEEVTAAFLKLMPKTRILKISRSVIAGVVIRRTAIASA